VGRQEEGAQRLVANVDECLGGADVVKVCGEKLDEMLAVGAELTRGVRGAEDQEKLLRSALVEEGGLLGVYVYVCLEVLVHDDEHILAINHHECILYIYIFGTEAAEGSRHVKDVSGDG